MQLRGYQTPCVEALRASYARGHRAPLLTAPTGSGKTHIIAAITASAAAKGRRVLVVAHRRELIRQASAKLTAAGVHHGIICAGFVAEPQATVQVASVQTLARRPNALLVPPPDLIVVDEAHHARAGQWRALLDANPNAKLLGVTATPARLDGRGLGVTAGGCFDDLIIGPSIPQLIAEGYLAPTRIFAPPERLDLSDVRMRGGDYDLADLERAIGSGRITGDCIEQYRLYADHQPAIAFCVSVQHAAGVAQRFRDAGYRGVCVHGGTPTAERDAAIAGLADGSVEVLASCDLISEGLDVPAVGAVILLRPTKSLVLYMQQVGRGMRPAPGKSALIVLDHVNNVLAHGLPDLERRWTLAGIANDPEPISEPARQGSGGCPRFITEEPGRLHELTAERLAAIRRMSYGQVIHGRLTEEELAAYAAHRGYKRGWVWHRLQDQRASARA
jgi:superfamily II DNA or RNA helicase